MRRFAESSTRRRYLVWMAGALATGALFVSACGGDEEAGGTSGAAAGANCAKKDEVRLVLQWVAQSQFAGYFAAKDKGIYEKHCLDVKIQEGGVNIVPQQVLSSGNAEFAVSHVTKTLVSREEGADIVNISQPFQRGAYLQVSWKDSGIDDIEDLRGTKVGSWGFGNELVLYSAMRANGVDPQKDTDVVQQPFDMSLLLKREVDSAQAKTYNEYAQLLETPNRETGKLYQPSDFNVINLQDEGFTSYEDGVYATASWLKDPAHQDIAVRFIRASLEGWIYCRDNFDECVDVVLDNGSTLGQGHMAWQLNEVNKLIWPTPAGIGTVDKNAWASTVKIALEGEVLKREPDADAYRADLNRKALEKLRADGADVTGEGFQPRQVTITPGGE
jgi:NitT/TauT family transport system substrate-binding protein